MENILFVNACVRPESRTMQLAEYILDRLCGQVAEVNLEQEQIQPLNRERLEERDAVLAVGQDDAEILRYANQFKNADTIVIAAPYWDLSFPAIVKNYLESVTVCGVTFKYSPDGIPIGLCKAKRLIYVMTAGGPVFSPDYGFDYVKVLAQNFYGIQDVKCFKAENLDIIGADVQKILNETKKEIDMGL
ncbi:MAG: NAD(P)H-dependent oxidoreductase [Coprococcus sp.]|nr:NAD(P)H-dependent oxidoreductase [Coprococcus sp.]